MHELEPGTRLDRDDGGRVLEVEASHPGTETSLGAVRAEYDDRTARLGPADPDYWGVWGSAVHDWEAEAG